MIEQDEDANESWQIACAGDRFDRWRNDAGFKAVVTLARIVNALSFSAYAMYGVEKRDSPAAARQRLNAFMYVGATLFEAIEFIDRVRADLTVYRAFVEKLAPLVDDPGARDLLSERLQPLRNRAVFHFDPTFVPRTPGAETDGFYIFAQGRSFKSGEMYYDLPDHSAMNTVIGVGPGHPEFQPRSRDLMKRTTRLMTDFMSFAHEVINEALDHPDWEPRILPPDGSPE